MHLQIVFLYFFAVNWWFCEAAALGNGTKNSSCENSLFYGNGIGNEKIQNAEFESALPRRKWISELFYEAQTAFRFNSDVSTACKKDFDLFKLHLRNQSTWAVKMMESSEWPFVGILYGMVDHLGNYDECLSISSYGIDGQYCLVEAMYNYSYPLHSEVVEMPDEKISTWDVVSMYEKNPIRINRKKLRFAVCIPSSCTPTDLKISLNNTLHPIFNAHELNITIEADPALCKIRDEPAPPLGYYIIRNLFGAIFFLVICSTLYDVVALTGIEMKTQGGSKKHLIKNISKLFSIKENFTKLTKHDQRELIGIQFVKVLNMIKIIIAHRLAFAVFPFPLSDAFLAEQKFAASAVLFAQTDVVTVFFLICGFLTFHLEFSRMLKGGIWFLLTNLSYRWMRMIPTFIFLVLYTIYIFPYIGDGPLWNYRTMVEVENCKESWLPTVFFINNFVNPEKSCIMSSWYLSMDIQHSIIGGILLYIFTKSRKVGVFAVILTYITVVAITFFVTIEKQLSGIVRLYFDTTKDILNDEGVLHIHMSTSARCAPYLLGFMTAYLLNIIRQKKIKFTNTQVYIFSFISILISQAVMFYGSTFYAFNKKNNVIENALFSALSYTLVVLQYAIIGLLYFTSGLGIFTKLIEWKVWVPLGRLTYSISLINILVQLHHVSSQRQPVSTTNTLDVVYWFIGDPILIYSCGLILHLFIEAPISNLNAAIRRRLLICLQNHNSTSENLCNESQLSKNKSE